MRNRMQTPIIKIIVRLFLFFSRSYELLRIF
jgi:hypothetical protein